MNAYSENLRKKIVNSSLARALSATFFGLPEATRRP